MHHHRLAFCTAPLRLYAHDTPYLQNKTYTEVNNRVTVIIIINITSRAGPASIICYKEHICTCMYVRTR